VETIKKRDQAVNVLINNASVGGVKNSFASKNTVEEVSQTLFASKFETWNQVLHLNSTAMYFLAGMSNVLCV
jgi:NAD(P)-dependent dehydrogenase (short-subunit alcohol dehydrogenase family)